jgi:hypothetical protein
MREPRADSQCDRCDDYLAGDLRQEDLESFERHCVECLSCAALVREERALRELLITATSSESIPDRLRERFDSSDLSKLAVHRPMTAPSRRRMTGAQLGVAAAVLTMGLSCWLLFETDPHGGRPLKPAVQSTQIPIIQHSTDAPLVEAQIGAPDDFITVPIQSRDPKISIFWAYPTKRVTRDDAGHPRLMNSVSRPSTGEST